jgi:hypothetical protein
MSWWTMEPDPHFTDDGDTLSFHCDNRQDVVVSRELVVKFVDEINRLRLIAANHARIAIDDRKP